MLPSASRLRLRQDFSATIKNGRRRGRQRLVVHLAVVSPDVDLAAGDGASAAPRASAPLAGFVVGRAVGGAVVRNRVRRQLRHLVAARLDRLPAFSRLVVRALPAAAGSTWDELGHDLDEALAGCLRGASREMTA